jgi:hypothetical protein
VEKEKEMQLFDKTDNAVVITDVAEEEEAVQVRYSISEIDVESQGKNGEVVQIKVSVRMGEGFGAVWLKLPREAAMYLAKEIQELPEAALDAN